MIDCVTYMKMNNSPVGVSMKLMSVAEGRANGDERWFSPPLKSSYSDRFRGNYYCEDKRFHITPTICDTDDLSLLQYLKATKAPKEMIAMVRGKRW